MIEDWVDELCKTWEISDDKFGTVRSYKLVGEADFPDSIDPTDLHLHPVALTIPNGMDPEYSEGGPRIGFYSGQTEFHVTPSLSRSWLPTLVPWYGRILRAATARMQLGGGVGVEYFVINPEAGIRGPVALQWGSENWHWGFVVQWTVKEHIRSLSVSR